MYMMVTIRKAMNMVWKIRLMVLFMKSNSFSMIVEHRLLTA